MLTTRGWIRLRAPNGVNCGCAVAHELWGLAKSQINIGVGLFFFNMSSDYGAFAVNRSLDPLSLGHFSPIFSPFFPFFRHLLHLAAKIQETGTKTPKNVPQRSGNGREKGVQNRLIANAR